MESSWLMQPSRRCPNHGTCCLRSTSFISLQPSQSRDSLEVYFVPREASTLKFRSYTLRTDLKDKQKSAENALFLRSVLRVQDRILKIRVLASLGMGTTIRETQVFYSLAFKINLMATKELFLPRNRNHKSLAIGNHNFEVACFPRRKNQVESQRRNHKIRIGPKKSQRFGITAL